MGTILTLAMSAYFFIISYRVQFTYFFFVFLIPFLPKYIGFGVGGEGFALSLKRILLMILFMSIALSFTQNSMYIYKRISQVYKHNKLLINLLFLFFIIKIVSLTLNSRELPLYIMLFNDFLFSIFMFILTILLIDSEENIHRLIKMFFYSYTIVLILVLIESIVQFPLLSIFASGQMELTRDYSEGFMRAGKYRTNGSFPNPILLGEYLVMLFPLIVAYMYRNKYTLTLMISYILLFMYAIYLSGSRSAILMSAMMVYLYFILTLYKGSRFSRSMAILFNVIILSIVFYFVFDYINNLIMSFSGRFDFIADEGERSSVSRALQYIVIYDKMHEAPFFGFGRERNYLTIFSELHAIDNYYFWTILEVGIIGILVYSFFLFALVKTALSQYKISYQDYYLLPLILSILMSILYQNLMANPANHIYLYIFAGLIAVMKILQNEKKKHTETQYKYDLKD